PAGSRVRIWLDRSGRWAGLPLNQQIVMVRVATAVIGTIIMVAAVLAAVGCVGQRLLDRRRLAGWEADWNAVGPQWTKEFRAGGWWERSADAPGGRGGRVRGRPRGYGLPLTRALSAPAPARRNSPLLSGRQDRDEVPGPAGQVLVGRADLPGDRGGQLVSRLP